MRRRGVAWGVSALLLVAASVSGQTEPLLIEDFAEHRASVGYQWDGMHRSDVLSNGFLRTLVVGGLLDAAELDAIRHRMARSGTGHLGATGGHALTWHGAVGPQERVPRVELASRAAFSAEVAEGLFGLVFQGNAPDLGQTTSLSPTHVRWLQWNRLAFGLGNATGTSFLDVGVYQAAWGADGGIADGGFWVAEDVDALEVGMEADVNFWERSGWGLGLDFRHQWGSERWIALEGRDLGVVRYGAGERLVVDTGLVTTGLGWSGPGWTVEGVQAEGFGSGLVERRSVGEGWQVLPMLGTVRAGAVHGKHVRGEGGVSWGGWMPRPRVEVMATWQPQAHWAFTGGAIAGGWGILRPVIGVERRSVDSAWSLTWDDPLGSVRSVGRGRGVAFSWIRNL